LFVGEHDAAVVEDRAVPFARRRQSAEQIRVLLDPESRDRRECSAMAIVRKAVVIVAQAEERL
jgi:hypothetical protein